MAATSRRTQLIVAVATIAAGLLAGALIHVQPAGLHVPAWVAYVAASAFVLAGLALVAGVAGVASLARWLGVAGTLSLFVVSAWVAFGPGERECPILCRGAFGVGAILVGLFLVGVLRRTFAHGSKA
jgi:hypothetical protein